MSGNVEIHVLPFSSLRLVASKGITIDRSEGIEVRVVKHSSLEGVSLGFDMLLLHSSIEVDEECFLRILCKIGHITI